MVFNHRNHHSLAASVLPRDDHHGRADGGFEKTDPHQKETQNVTAYPKLV